VNISNARCCTRIRIGIANKISCIRVLADKRLNSNEASPLHNPSTCSRRTEASNCIAAFSRAVTDRRRRRRTGTLVLRERENWHNDDDTGKSRGVSRAHTASACLPRSRREGRRSEGRRQSNRRAASLILGGILTARPLLHPHPTQNTPDSPFAPPKIKRRTSQVARTFHRADCTPPLCCLLFAVLFLPLTLPSYNSPPHYRSI
jgi:hypothetical protein